MEPPRTDSASRTLLEACVGERFEYAARNETTGELEVVYVARGRHAHRLVEALDEARRRRPLAERALQWLANHAAD